MKKLLLFALGFAMLTPMAQAQDEIGDDVTKYVANAGFDDDLTFQNDGSWKNIIDKTKSLSERSWAWIAEDSTVYAHPKETSSQNRPDGRKMEAVNGFIGRIKGWTVETNQNFPSCEWVYFGSVPYDLGGQAVPIADDGTSYLTVPQRPAAVEGENTGFAYLRAGWGGRAVYKQVVKLPCAKYELSYWAININPSATNGKNLSKVTCRKDVWEDETGFTDTEWTRHSIEFTPTDEFTLEFGFESQGGSNSNPFLCIDGIKLIKIDEADEAEILLSDIRDLLKDIEEGANMLTGDVIYEYYDLVTDIGVEADVAEVEELRAIYERVKGLARQLEQTKANIDKINALLDKANKLAETTNYPGHDALLQAIETYGEVLNSGSIESIDAAVDGLEQAINNYYQSQPASMDEPANYTHLVKNPWFVIESAEPTLEEDGTAIYPNAENYTSGSTNFVDGSANTDLTSEGWYIGEGGGDQRLNYVQGRTCWNAWNSNFNTVTISQDLTGLPNGFYKVQADLITQPDMATDQHVFAKSSLGSANSDALEVGNWNDGDNGAWTPLRTKDAVIVVDGKLTIGATGSHGNSEVGAAGWFCATNFQLLYCGPASAEQIAEALANRLATAQDLVAKMHFAADKAVASDSLNLFNSNYDLELLNNTIALAEASESKYEEIMADGKTIPTVRDSLANYTDAYGAAREIVEYALNYVNNWIASPQATYTEVDNILNLMKNYVNTYAPVFNEAAEMAANSQSGAVKDALNNIMAAQKATLLSEMCTAEKVNQLVDELKTMMYNANKQELYDQNPDATDYTAFIQNPKAESETGWTLIKGTGDKNTTSGQYYTEDGTRYFDSYNSTRGALNFYGEQKIIGLPNGTYTVKVEVRTSGDGAFIFAGNCGTAKNDTIWKEMPLQTRTYQDDNTGEMVTDTVTDTYGQIYEEAVIRFATMTSDDPDYYYVQSIFNANAGKGRGWERMQIDGVVVNNHEMVIGMTTDSLRTGKPFTGMWFSATNWQLELTKKGDNTGWNGPLATGIEDVIIAAPKAADGIYTINGVKVNAINRQGLYIIVRNGKAQKFMVK